LKSELKIDSEKVETNRQKKSRDGSIDRWKKS